MAGTPDVRWTPDTVSGGRRPLSRHAIVTTAVAIADAERLDAVSMPRLARELEAAPMSLYRHVPHKDALIDLMLDAAIGDAPAVDDTRGWRPRLTEWARANRAVFVAHPWTLPLVSGTRRIGPAECAWAEAALRVMADAGLPPMSALQVVAAVNSYVRGASAPIEGRAPSVDAMRAAGRLDDFPLLAPLLGGEVEPPAGALDDFEFGLARVLDGIEAHLAGRAP